ncbi:MAG: histidinol dehydrogenase [Acutalibacteraceae bacterium]|nr:histidinol dehydrogenase [Acutalibacteraceae bacterium]
MIRIINKEDLKPDDIFCRRVVSEDISATVRDIIGNVIENGDRALLEYSEKFDKVKLESIEVTKEEIDKAYNSVPKEFIDILNEAAENIRVFHRNQLRSNFMITNADGAVLGQKYIPLNKVGLYVPGGTAPLSSSVLMNCIPAKIAGCNEIVMVTPPSKDGNVNAEILAAARVAGVDRVFKVGGAQAIAALAYSTESLPKVDQIVGPGNAYVAEAKRQVYGLVSIDMIAGPSEILVIADGTCRAKNVAADLLSQAEHDKMASAVLVTDSKELAAAVSDELEKQIPLLSRCEIARTSIDNNGKIIITGSIDEAIEIANEIAPEHLEICVDNPFDYLDRIKNAGSVFMGKYCPEALGDYFAGANHVLPTSGTARFSSPLSVDDFIKKTQFMYYTNDALGKVSDKVAYFANKEQLGAHARSATVRFEED